MFNIYTTHKGSHITHPAVETVEEVAAFAQASAALGHDVLVRCFRQVEWADSVTGEQFETAYSVLGGEVTEHRRCTIPQAHW